MAAWCAQHNQGFEKAERLDDNIGYLDFRGFFPIENAAPVAAGAMAFLAHTSAMIVDLRQNGGGSPDMVAYMCSWFLPESPSVHLNDIYDRVADTIRQYWTVSHLPGPRFLNKPLCLLTSASTFSGAEEFAYNLQQNGRAKVVGERTGGGAHPTRWIRLHPHFALGVPFARAINPITGTNWEGQGLTPDIEVPAADALASALALVTAANAR